MQTVQLYSAFDPSSVNFSGLEKNKKGGKVVFVSIPDAAATGRQRLTIQTPTVAIPFGVSPYQEATTGEIQSYSVDMSFRGSDTDPRISEFLAKMRAFDDVLLDTAVANSKEWFGKQMSKEILSEFYRKLVKDPANPKYPPVMKAKVQLNNGQPTAMFFDESRQPQTIDYLEKGSTVKMILEVDRIWFVNKNFGVTWRLLQAAVCSKPHRLEGYGFQEEADGLEDVAEEF